MYKGLYDCFKHWYHGGQVYFYADPHFGDAEMSQLRGVTDEEQLKNINAKVGKNDTIVILGDVGDVNWVAKIRGYKVLIKGNHDAGASNYKRVIYNVWNDDFDQLERRDNHLFNEVYEGALMISNKVILSHEPIDFDWALNIHGHDHAGLRWDDYHYNVCAESINYVPISLQSIIEAGYLTYSPDIHRYTIDRATDRKKYGLGEGEWNS